MLFSAFAPHLFAQVEECSFGDFDLSVQIAVDPETSPRGNCSEIPAVLVASYPENESGTIATRFELNLAQLPPNAYRVLLTFKDGTTLTASIIKK